jgi:flagellar basal body rod protein FlgF
MEDLKLYYSIDGGSTFKLLRQFNSSDISYNKWSSQKITLPPEAKTSSTIIEFHQPQSSGPQYDHWGLANIQFSSQPADPVVTTTPTGGGEVSTQQVYTRAGSFQLSKDGYFVNSSGLKLLGYDLKNEQNLVPIKIPFNNGTDEGLLQGISIDSKGMLSVNYAGEQTPAELYRVTVATFPNSTALRSIGDTNYATSGDSGNPRFGFGGDKGFGTVMSGSLEESNVDITEELVQLLRGQQIYNANSRVLQTVVEVNKRVTDKL